jgi:hypothetical protein
VDLKSKVARHLRLLQWRSGYARFRTLPQYLKLRLVSRNLSASWKLAGDQNVKNFAAIAWW